MACPLQKIHRRLEPDQKFSNRAINKANNIKTIDDGQGVKKYDYDVNNQLARSVIPGKFLEQDPTPGTYGLKVGDYLGATWMDFTVKEITQLKEYPLFIPPNEVITKMLISGL